MQASNGLRLWIAIGLWIWEVVFSCVSARADAIAVIYRGTEVIEGGQPPFNTYYIDCQPKDANTKTQVDISISYNNGTSEIRTGEYCNTKIYVNGAINGGVIVHSDGTHAVIAVAAISAPEPPTATTTPVPPTETATTTITPTAESTSMPTPTRVMDTNLLVYLPLVGR